MAIIKLQNSDGETYYANGAADIIEMDQNEKMYEMYDEIEAEDDDSEDDDSDATDSDSADDSEDDDDEFEDDEDDDDDDFEDEDDEDDAQINILNMKKCEVCNNSKELESEENCIIEGIVLCYYCAVDIYGHKADDSIAE